MESEIFNLIDEELQRQQDNIELIASENIVSKNVLKASGSILTNKYAEGYPNHRYYNGCGCIDKIETIAIETAKKLFNCNFANVQPANGTAMNWAAMNAVLESGDVILGMSLDAGGHLSHGHKVSASGKYFKAIQYGVDNNGILDYQQLEDLLNQHKPKMLIVGASAYPREIDYKKINEIRNRHKENTGNKPFVLVDIAHISGLVATGYHQTPFGVFPDSKLIVTTTTHKTLRGARGGLILCNDEKLAEKIDKSVFPGIQGGPLEHIIAAKAITFIEALKPEYKEYIGQVVKNIKAMEKTFIDNNVKLVSGGSDNHLLLLDLRNFNIDGQSYADLLEKINITANKNSVPNDTNFKKPCGLRIGTPAITTRGFKETDCEEVAKIMIDMLKKECDKEKLKERVKTLTTNHPIYD
ncbi:MAG: serine hydroxymethyltransferase [Rickettsiales bacterium]|nr:MAG: serine hydroxymethyltransferase [Rickettsiales bacterium]